MKRTYSIFGMMMEMCMRCCMCMASGAPISDLFSISEEKRSAA